MALKIREYKGKNKSDVIFINKDIFNSNKPHNDPNVVIDMKTKQKDYLFFVAEENNQIVGTIIAGFDGNRGWIYSIISITKKRNQGIRKLLFKKAINELIKLGCIKLNLQIYTF